MKTRSIVRPRAALTALCAVVMTAVTAPGTATAAESVPGAAAPPPASARVVERTERSVTVVDGSGTRTVTLHTGPVRVLRGTEWVPVELTLLAGPDGLVRPASAPHDLVLAPTGPSVRFAGGGSAALAWPTPLPPPVLTGHRATYPLAAPGHDLVVEATRVGFVASLRRAEGAPPAPVPELVLTGSAEAVPDPAAPAGLTETASAVSRVVAAAPPQPGNPAPFDTTVQTTILRTDTSGEPDLRLGSYDGAAVARSYLSWDLTPMTGRPVAAATLRLHQDWAASCRPRAWEVWSAPPVGPATRWADQPVADRRWATSTDTRGNPAGQCAAGWSEVDVTDLVRSWAQEGLPDGTMQLRAADEADPLSWKRFGSAESPNVPELRVTLG